MQVTAVGRSAGRTAIGAAAYRAGERLRDERSGTLYNYADRQDVLHSEIVLPSRFTGSQADWARDRATLWNTAEHAEIRRDARVAREYMLALPHELSAAQRVALTRTLSKELADRYGVAIDAALHAPRAHGDPRNYHVHLLATTREVTATGLGAKTGLDLNETRRYELGLGRSSEEFLALRERSATLINDALQAADLVARVDHRSLAAQGIDREPRARLPWGAYLAEKRGLHSAIAERVREKYRARLESRAQRLARAPALAPAPVAAAGPKESSLGDIRRSARESWLRLRASPVRGVEQGKEQGKEQGSERDFAL